MNSLDYYTVMESRIKYFAQKYDPQNKFVSVAMKSSDNQKQCISTPIKKVPIRRKILVELNSVFSFFF